MREQCAYILLDVNGNFDGIRKFVIVSWGFWCMNSIMCKALSAFHGSSSTFDYLWKNSEIF